MESVSSKFAAVIHYKFSHEMVRELAASKDIPGYIIQDNADLDIYAFQN
jgi:hypothetical protein